MRKIVEIRNARNLQLLDSKEIKSYRKYQKICMQLLKVVERHNKNKIKMGQNTEYIIRIRQNSFLIKSDNFGYIVGLKEPKNIWL